MRRLCLIVALFAMGFTGLSLRAEDAKDPKPAPANTPKADAQRTPQQIQADLQKAGGELQGVLTSPQVFIDPAQRKEAAPKVIPIMKRMSTLFDEVVSVQPQAKEEIAGAKLEFLTLLSLFGDADSTAALGKLAKEKGDLAVAAQAGQQLVAFWSNPKDEAAQLKALDEVQKIAKANPKDEALVGTLMKMSKMGAASKAVSEKAETVLVTDLTSEGAQQVAAQIKGERKMKESVGKPVELAGTQIDGKPFTTKDWKGKVIFVDFWATWCGPCLAELPRVKRVYLDYHAKGLEILGVSCDRSADDLKAFLEKNKDMPWPQLYDAKENPKIQWNPLAKEWGINGIPTMFLIDKKGILRSVEAREDFEKEIPKLLDEKAE
jgi:thiol-disulfide isomerase/thioredoxin